MSIFLRVPLGLIIMVIGFYMVSKSGVFITWFGRIPFAENKFGSGGTYLFYKLLGVLFVFLGAAIATNVINAWLKDFGCLLAHVSGC
ncbi:MAG: hypothetical protein HQ488_02035 [Parcubacteria group bacterium]|nr:hypothetical protein [Parcubacteria group bacterium]